MKYDVKVTKTLVIDAQSESVVPARLETMSASPMVGLIEASQKLSDRYRLYGACTLSSPGKDGQVTFRILNPSDTPVILYKGSNVGRFEPLNSSGDVIALESSELGSPIDNTSGKAESSCDEPQLPFQPVSIPSLTPAETTKLMHFLVSFPIILLPHLSISVTPILSCMKSTPGMLGP